VVQYGWRNFAPIDHIVGLWMCTEKMLKVNPLTLADILALAASLFDVNFVLTYFYLAIPKQ
jgi:hypothetical protein